MSPIEIPLPLGLINLSQTKKNGCYYALRFMGRSQSHMHICCAHVTNGNTFGLVMVIGIFPHYCDTCFIFEKKNRPNDQDPPDENISKLKRAKVYPENVNWGKQNELMLNGLTDVKSVK